MRTPNTTIANANETPRIISEMIVPLSRLAREQREPRDRRAAQALPQAALALEQDLDAQVRHREQQELDAHAGEGVRVAVVGDVRPEVTACSCTAYGRRTRLAPATRRPAGAGER